MEIIIKKNIFRHYCLLVIQEMSAQALKLSEIISASNITEQGHSRSRSFSLGSFLILASLWVGRLAAPGRVE